MPFDEKPVRVCRDCHVEIQQTKAEEASAVKSQTAASAEGWDIVDRH